MTGESKGGGGKVGGGKGGSVQGKGGQRGKRVVHLWHGVALAYRMVACAPPGGLRRRGGACLF
jgi:hypothetical protein